MQNPCNGEHCLKKKKEREKPKNNAPCMMKCIIENENIPTTAAMKLTMIARP
jgi:hypothetical protein